MQWFSHQNYKGGGGLGKQARFALEYVENYVGGMSSEDRRASMPRWLERIAALGRAHNRLGMGERENALLEHLVECVVWGECFEAGQDWAHRLVRRSSIVREYIRN